MPGMSLRFVIKARVFLLIRTSIRFLGKMNVILYLRGGTSEGTYQIFYKPGTA